jgi:hypothetical protein
MSINGSDAFEGYAWMTSDCGQGPHVPWADLGGAVVVNFSVQWEVTRKVPMAGFAGLQNSLSEDPQLHRQRNGQQVDSATGHKMVMQFIRAVNAAGMKPPPFSYKHGREIRAAALAALEARGMRLGQGQGPGMPIGPVPAGPHMQAPGMGMRMGPMGMGMGGPPGRMMGPGPMGFVGPRGMMGPGMGPGMGMLHQPPPPPGLSRRLAERLQKLPEDEAMGQPQQQQQRRGRSRSPGGTRGSRGRSRSRSPVGVAGMSYEGYLELYGRVKQRIAAVRGQREADLAAEAAAAAAAPGKGGPQQRQQQQQQQQQRQPQQQQLAVPANGGWGNPAAGYPGPPGAGAGGAGGAGAGRGRKAVAGGGAGGGGRGQQQPMAAQQVAAGGGPMGGMPGMGIPTEAE